MRRARTPSPRVELLLPTAERYLTSERARRESAMCSVVVLEGTHPVTVDDVRDAVARRVHHASALHRVLQPGLLGLTAPAWVDPPPGYDPGDHVVVWPGSVREPELGEVASRVLAEPLDLSRPPWRFVVVEVDDVGFALVQVLHHSVGHGALGMAVLDACYSAAAPADEPPPLPSNPPRGRVHLTGVVLRTWLAGRRSPADAWRHYRRRSTLARVRRVVGRNIRVPRELVLSLVRPPVTDGGRQVIELRQVDLRSLTRQGRAWGASPMDLILLAAGRTEAHRAGLDDGQVDVLLSSRVTLGPAETSAGGTGVRLTPVRVPVGGPPEEALPEVTEQRKRASDPEAVSRVPGPDARTGVVPPYVSVLPVVTGEWRVAGLHAVERYLLPFVDTGQPWSVAGVSGAGRLDLASCARPGHGAAARDLLNRLDKLVGAPPAVSSRPEAPRGTDRR